MQLSRRNQSGIALLTFVILVALAAITYYFATISPTELKVDRQQQNRLMLKQAKQALIAHALTHADQPGDAGEFGDLPCPDANSTINNEGEQDPSCGNDEAVSDLGYLPWKTLGIDALKDYSGTCLYYAVSPSYKITSNLVMLNEDTNGLIQIVDSAGFPIKGAAADTRPVAVVLAAGAALAGQNRSPNNTTICGLDYNISAYLDYDGVTDNSTLKTADKTIRKFVSASPGSENKPQPVNDQLITISRAEIWKAIVNRSDFKTKINNLTHALALCLARYTAETGNAGRRLPWPAPIDLAGAGGDYRDNASYDDAAGGLYAGRFPYKVGDSNAKTSVSVVDDVIFNTPGCDNLTVNGGTTVNLNNLSTEYGKLWQNWKDHFFYAISKVYQPETGGTPSMCASNCITVKDSTSVVTPYAGIVFYSGSRLSGQSRDAPIIVGDNNDKADISNYLENGNDAVFAGALGTESDAYSTNGADPALSNDVMWCIKDMPVGSALEVAPC